MGDEAEGSKSLVLKLYGPELGPKLAYAAGYGRGYNYRKVLEPTDATTQCENTGHSFKGGMPCYMCGLPIPAKATMKGAADELWPECEHILPLTEGRWLLDIYITNRLQTDPWSTEARTLEYDQAHRVCNQAKRIQSFIVTKKDGTASVSESAVKSILIDVTKRASTNVARGDRRATMSGIASMNLEERTAALVARVQRLVNHINTAPFNQAGQGGLVLLMQTALFVDPDTLLPPARLVHDEWYKNKAGRDQAYATALSAFIRETEADYPILASPVTRTAYLGRLLARNDMERGFLASVVPPLDDILRRIFEAKAETPVDPSGAHFLSLVLYGLYSVLYAQLQTKDTEAQALRCEIYKRMSMLLTLPGPKDTAGRDTPPLQPRPSDVFGAPSLSPGDERVCKKLTEADARALRDELRAAEEESEAGVIDSILRGVSDGLDATLPRVGIAASTKAPLLDYAKKALETYLATLPGSVYGAQLIAARAVSEQRDFQFALLVRGFTSAQFRDMLLPESMVFARGAARRKTQRRRKARKTLRKRFRA